MKAAPLCRFHVAFKSYTRRRIFVFFKNDDIHIAFVILDKYSDMEKIPPNIVEEIGAEKFIFMDTYRKIEELWPTHLME